MTCQKATPEQGMEVISINLLLKFTSFEKYSEVKPAVCPSAESRSKVEVVVMIYF